MNQILVATIIAVSIIGTGAYAASQVFEMSAASSRSSDIDIEKKSENMNVFFNDGSINITNTGKDPSEIAMFRFYDSSGIEVHRVMIQDENGRTFGIHSQVSDSELTSVDAHLPRHTTQSFSLVDLGIDSLEDITGELVTQRGRTFPISFDGFSEKTGEGGEGGTGGEDGTAVLDALGVSLNIHNIITDGFVYFGNDLIGFQTDIRPYVGVNPDDDWIIAISNNDPKIILLAPEFVKEYRYHANSLVDITPDTLNILGYTNSERMSGSNNIGITHDDGITLSGDGTRIIKLNSYDDILIRGTLNNADVKIVTSPLDLTTLSMSGNSYTIEQTTPSKVSTGTWIHCHWIGHCSGQYGPVQNTHIHPQWDMVSSLNLVVAQETVFAGSYYTTQSCFGYRNACHSSPYPPAAHYSSGNHGHTIVHSETSTFTTSNVPDGIKITKQITTGNMKSYSTPIHRITSAAPWNELYHFPDSFEQQTSLPTNSYMVVTLNDGSATIKGESFNPDSDVFFKVTNLPADRAFDVSKSGITGVIGKTSSGGEISLSHDDVDFGIATSPGGTLRIHPDSVSHIGYLGSALIDMYNKKSIPLNIGNDLVYIPQNYVRWIFPVAVDVTNVRVDDIELDYLDGNYVKNGALVIPVIPSADTIYATINGIGIEVLMRDVSVYSQIKQVLKKSATSSDHSISEAVSTSSNIATSTFLTATHIGTAIANIDIRVGGSAEFSMDSSYTGEFKSVEYCRINYGTERLNKSCHTDIVPTNHASITNMQSLSLSHQNQLITALNNGQLSQITVDVDIIKNMEYVKTVTIYTSLSPEIDIECSELSNVRYGTTHKVCIEYPLTSITNNIAIPVDVGDMIEYVIRVNLDVKGAKVPTSNDGGYSSYVKATTKFDGGVITVGMS